MDVKEFRKTTGLSQSKFAEYFGIPVATVQGWEIRNRTPPPYVLDLMIKVWNYEHDKRIEDATRKFVEEILSSE